jgi:hypothetical protein
MKAEEEQGKGGRGGRQTREKEEGRTAFNISQFYPRINGHS